MTAVFEETKGGSLTPTLHRSSGKEDGDSANERSTSHSIESELLPSISVAARVRFAAVPTCQTHRSREVGAKVSDGITDACRIHVSVSYAQTRQRAPEA